MNLYRVHVGTDIFLCVVRDILGSIPPLPEIANFNKKHSILSKV